MRGGEREKRGHVAYLQDLGDSRGIKDLLVKTKKNYSILTAPFRLSPNMELEIRLPKKPSTNRGEAHSSKMKANKGRVKLV